MYRKVNLLKLSITPGWSQEDAIAHTQRTVIASLLKKLGISHYYATTLLKKLGISHYYATTLLENKYI